MSKCIKCGEETDISLTPDLDIDGIPVCNNCKDLVKWDLLMVSDGIKSKRWFNKKYKLKL